MPQFPDESLADQLMAACTRPTRMLDGLGDPAGSRRMAASLTARMRRSRRFIIDDEVVQAATQLGAEHPDMLAGMMGLARLPFPSIWLEWSLQAQISQLGRDLEDDAPRRVGVFIEQPNPDSLLFRSFAVTTTLDTGRFAVGTLSTQWRLDGPLLHSERPDGDAFVQRCCGLSEDVLRQIPVGEPSSKWIAAAEDEEERSYRMSVCAKLGSHVRLGLNDEQIEIVAALKEASSSRRSIFTPDAVRRIMREHLLESAGEWRVVISILAIMASPKLVERTAEIRTHKSRTFVGKTVPYLENHRLVMRLSRQEAREELFRAAGPLIPRRRHQVAGHWRQNRKLSNPDCKHVYVEDSPTRDICLLCGHKRWWVADFARGDAGVGFVSRETVVKS